MRIAPRGRTVARVVPIFFALQLAVGQESGLPAEWDVRKMIALVGGQVNRLTPLVARLHPESWTRSGAPVAYIDQWKALEQQLRAVSDAGAALARQPDRLSLALEVYFQYESAENVLGALIEGVRRYQDPAIADSMQALKNECNRSRNQLRQYAADLAREKEREFKLMDHEAQRCRGSVIPPAPGRRAVRK